MSKVIIIAEAGVNHNGDKELARELIREAKDAGADYVKFQTFITELNISKKAKKAKYQIDNTGEVESQYEMVKKLELSFADFTDLSDYCNEIGIQFLATGFDYPSIDFLNDLKQPFFKIPSGEITNKPYLEYIASKGKRVVLSTGMANIEEVRDAMNVLLSSGLSKNDITILHCNTEYPTPMEDVNLKAMLHIQKEFDIQVGYSDHTLGIEVPIAAVALGAEVIEKHFTLDRTMKGPDHAASLEPGELKNMITSIRNIEQAISGSGIKEPSKSERKNLVIARKSIHIGKDMKKGDKINVEDLVMKRPGDGISPMDIDKVLGKSLSIDITKDTKLEWSQIR